MEKIIYLIGDSEHQIMMRDVADNLKKVGYNAIICTVDLLFNRWSFALNAELAIFFIGGHLNKDTGKLSKERYVNSKYSLNIFCEPIVLSKEQKDAIGKNDSVFLAVSNKDYLKEITDLLRESENFKFFGVSSNLSIQEENERYEVSSEKSKSKIWIVIIAAACIFGFGIWGYSAYIESSQEAAEENLWESWSEYLDKTDSGRMLMTMGKLFLKKDVDEFKDYGFKHYINGKIEATGDLSWVDIGPYISGISIKYNPPLDFNSYLAGPLKELYNMATEEGVDNSDYWNPINVLNKSREVIIDEITVNSDGSRGEIFYSIPNNPDNVKLGIMMDKFPGEWLISDFYYGDLSFAYLLESFKQKILASETINYIGNVYTPSGTFPISLIIEFNSIPSINAIYNNINSNITLNMSGYTEDGYITLFYEDTNQKVSFDLARDSNSVLTGKFEVITLNDDKKVESKSYDVILKEEIPE